MYDLRLDEQQNDQASFRAACHRCLRPTSDCYCAHLVPTSSRTRVVFLQHPRERRVAFGTARMAHLALPNSELHVGVNFDDHPHVRQLAAAPDGRTVVLFPTPSAVEPEALPNDACRSLLVIDGTWIQARKMLARSALLRSLPRVGFHPSLPSRYRIRREPAPHCRATIEAVVETLGRLDHDVERYLPILRAFNYMVERQLHYKASRPNPYSRASTRRHRPRPDPSRRELRARQADLVVVYGEANAHPRTSNVPGSSELVHLVALRLATGESFAATIAPRRPLASSAPGHLGVSAAALLNGEPVADTLARWCGFLRPRDVLCTWGRFTLDLLRAEGEEDHPTIDLRAAATQRLGRRGGGAESAARLLGASDPHAPWTDGRAGVRIVALAQIVERLAA